MTIPVADQKGLNWSDQSKRGQDFTRVAGQHCGLKNGSGADCSLQRRHSHGSRGRAAASALIAKIPLPLSRHIAATYRVPA